MRKKAYFAPYLYCMTHVFYPMCVMIAAHYGWGFRLYSVAGFSIVISVISLVTALLIQLCNGEVSQSTNRCMCFCWGLAAMNMLTIVLQNEMSYQILIAIAISIESGWFVFLSCKVGLKSKPVIGGIALILTMTVLFVAIFNVSHGGIRVSKLINTYLSPEKGKMAIITLESTGNGNYEMICVESNSKDILHIGSVYTDSRVVYYEEDSMGSSLKVGWMDEYTLRIYDENDTIRTIDLR